jgi:DNA-binding transcriptional LysR family regulator
MCDAALQGVGLAWMSECAVAEGVTADRLITVLDDWSGRTAGLCLYYPGYWHVPADLRAFIDVIHELSPADHHSPDEGSSW